MAQRPSLTFGNFTSRRNILEKLFQNDLAPPKAAKELATASLADLAPNADSEDVEEQMGITWACIIVAAREQPAMQEKLVELLLAMRNLAGPKALEARPWVEVPGLGMEFNHEWNAFILSEAGKERQEGIDAFVNVNRFAARLFQADSQTFNYALFALWTMRSALESPVSPRDPNADALEAFLPAAAAWIDIAGSSLRKCEQEWPPSDKGGSPGKGGYLWEGKHGFCVERWKFWEKRFEELKNDDELEQGLRDVARTAGEQMRKID